jgi:serine/threonine protein kinase
MAMAAGHNDLGVRLGKYRLVRLVGEGGMGSVYEAVHDALHKKVAVKTLLPQIAANPLARARFSREGQAASRIRHPNVVDVTDVDSHDGTPFLVMEYLEGETLAELFAREGAVPLPRLLDLLLPVFSAVAAGHHVGVIHRDLKPQNVFLARSGRGELVPKVLDFGISKLIGADVAGKGVTATGASLGTVAYMSPEQAEGAKNADERSDQYSLALILYEGCTGRRAYQGDNAFALLRQISAGNVPPASSLRSDLPQEFESVLMRALSLRPDARHRSVSHLGGALLPFASPRSRLLFGEEFGEATASLERPTAVATATFPPPPVPRGAHPPPSTLAAETRDIREIVEAPPSVRRRATSRLAIVVLGAVAAAVTLIALRHHEPREEPTTTPLSRAVPSASPSRALARESLSVPSLAAPEVPAPSPVDPGPAQGPAVGPTVSRAGARRSERRPQPHQPAGHAPNTEKERGSAPSAESSPPASSAPRMGTNNAIILP